MARKPKTIITCAITGAIHTPTMSDALPYTADDITAQAVADRVGHWLASGEAYATYLSMNVCRYRC